MLQVSALTQPAVSAGTTQMLLAFIKYVYSLSSHLLEALLLQCSPHPHRALILPKDKLLRSSDSSSSHLHRGWVGAALCAGMQSPAAVPSPPCDRLHQLQQAFQTSLGSRPLCQTCACARTAH